MRAISDYLDERTWASRIHWLQIARAGWVFLALVAVVILFMAIPGYLSRQPMGNLADHLVYKPTPFMVAVNSLNLIGAFIAVLIAYALAATLFFRRKSDPMALFTAYYLIFHALLFGGVVEMLEPYWPEAAAVNSFILLPLIFLPLTATLLAIFPSGNFVPSWTRWPVVISFMIALPSAVLTKSALSNSADSRIQLLLAAAATLHIILTFSMIYAQIQRYRHFSTRLERQQTKWIVYGFMVTILLFVLGSIPWSFALSLPTGTQVPGWLPVVESSWIIAMAILPVTLAISILRYRLYEVDLVINRTLVYGALSAAVVGLYVLVVGTLSIVFQAQENLFIALMATGLVAVIFQPLRERLQHTVNQLMYGDRDQPFAALDRLGRRLDGVLSQKMVYPTIVETVAQTLKLPYVAISIKRKGVFDVVESYGMFVDERTAYPLAHHGEVIGQLSVGHRSPDEDFSKDDKRILQSFARQAGTAIHAVQLTDDLKRSRQQLVTAREEERLRLRRDLHDGLGPALASVVWQVESAKDILASEPLEAEKLMESCIEQIRSALDDIRRLVYGLRPPALDELGLESALRQAAQHHQTNVIIESSAPLPALPAAVEVATYRIVLEAIRNAEEHGRATNCAVNLAINGSLRVVISDNGLGLPDSPRSGVGLVSMRERAEELGGSFKIERRPEGGTRVEVSLPLYEDN